MIPARLARSGVAPTPRAQALLRPPRSARKGRRYDGTRRPARWSVEQGPHSWGCDRKGAHEVRGVIPRAWPAPGCRCDSVCAAGCGSSEQPPESGGICDAAALRPVPHHRSGDRGRGAPTPMGAGTAPPSAGRGAKGTRNKIHPQSERQDNAKYGMARTEEKRSLASYHGRGTNGALQPLPKRSTASAG